MLETLKLLLPIFIPSWQFFKEIAPSPRIEFTLLKTEQDQAKWQEFNLQPQESANLLTSLFHNPRWNESLYIANCAEQLIADPQEYYSQEILKRIQTELERKQMELSATPYLQFRLIFISKQNGELKQDLLYSSETKRISE